MDHTHNLPGHKFETFYGNIGNDSAEIANTDTYTSPFALVMSFAPETDAHPRRQLLGEGPVLRAVVEHEHRRPDARPEEVHGRQPPADLRFHGVDTDAVLSSGKL